MNDLNDLYYFAAVVDHGGFAAAERALRLSPGDPAAERLVGKLRGQLAPLADRASPASLDALKRFQVITKAVAHIHLSTNHLTRAYTIKNTTAPPIRMGIMRSAVRRVMR